MNSAPNSSKNNAAFDENDVFEDSAFAAKFQESTFDNSTAGVASNLSANKSLLNVSALCCDEEISGYDKLTGKTWIYPTNYSVRDYQYNIIQAALLKNTLVSLPTGLGKTFIAAVVMYNFFRWYPLGKIVFTAPTRPLVAQQIDACYNIMAIPPSDTIEMTGNMQANTRKIHWKNKRVFFATPQVIYNDIKSGICPSDKIRCLVIDEAHRARGNYAYGQIVRALEDLGHKTYRMLALSATPGSKVEDVVNVVKHLNIAHLELRTEECIDVAPYSHSRRIVTEVIELGPQLTQLRDQYVEILDGYARRLKQLNILPHNVGNLSKGRIVMLYKEFQTKERGARHPQHNYIMKDFTVLIALFHGLELLTKHGSRVFLNFFDEHPEKSWIQSDDRLTALLERLRDDLGVNPLSLDRSILPDGTIPEIPKDLCFGHPKFDKLREIVINHFNKAKELGQDTRAIVFCEYRESVSLAHALLLAARPLLAPAMFVGQGASGKDGKAMVSQKQQLRVMRNFREGICNVLVATCVAEEGLDVGSVDLIVCFDISTRSPVRLVQRCGRTGRARGGAVHLLVAAGGEQRTLQLCQRQRDNLHRSLSHSPLVAAALYSHNPRMVPHGVVPACQKMFITVEKKTEAKEAKAPATKGQKNIRNMLMSRASSSGSVSSVKEPEARVQITEDEFKDMFPEGFRGQNYFNDAKEYWCMNRETLEISSKTEDHHAKLSTWLEWQRNLQNTITTGHSADAHILSSLLQSSDAKKFDMPETTQNPTFSTQDLNTQVVSKPAPVAPKIVKKKPKAPVVKTASKNDGDIRALFSTATKSTKNYTKLINDLGIQNNGSIPTSLIDLLVDFTLETTSKNKKCYVCASLDDCSIFKNFKRSNNDMKLKTFLNDPRLPDIDLIGDIKPGSIAECVAKVATDSQFLEAVDEIIVANKNVSTNFDLEFDFSSPELECKEKSKDNLDKNFDIGDIEDIFNESSPDDAALNLPVKDKNSVNLLSPVVTKDINCSPCDKKEEKNSSNPKEALEFFGLNSIDDIFADSDDSGDKIIPSEGNKTLEPAAVESTNDVISIDDKIPSQQAEVNEATRTQRSQIPKPLSVVRPLSPSILSGTTKVKEPTSPILCSQKKFQLSRKPRPTSSTPVVKNKDLLNYNHNISLCNSFKTPTQAANNLNATTNSINASNNKSMFTITQLVEMINKTNDESKPKSTTKEEDKMLADILKENERSSSPILLTQAERTRSVLNTWKNKTNTSKKNESLIILDSDSDSDDTVDYSFDNNAKVIKEESQTVDFRSPVSVKRKFEDECAVSPYFAKRQKMDTNKFKQLSLREKIEAALSVGDPKPDKHLDANLTNHNNISFMITQSQKENRSPLKYQINKIENSKDSSPFAKLQMFRRDNNRRPLNGIKKPENIPKVINFDDSDDDFITDSKNRDSPLKSSVVNHKIRKKSKKANEFLELEAELSGGSDSGDELSDDSAGSLRDFICDAPPDPAAEADVYAHYARSVKSRPIGQFKIPELPKRFNNDEIFSQFVEEDSYEMDSFCVDSHIGLTQANDVSELELAEQMLEKRRKARRKVQVFDETCRDSDKGDSPIVKRVNRNAKRRISSDSDSC